MTSSQLHKCLAVFWALLTIPTVLWWRDSVFFVSIVSIYANLVGHWSAFQASKAEEKVDEECHDGNNPSPTPDYPRRPPYSAISSPPEAPTSPPGPENDSTPSLPLQTPPEAPQSDEKARRMYYQGIVYRVCNLLELTKEGTSSICCGTVENPSVEVEVALAEALCELKRYRQGRLTEDEFQNLCHNLSDEDEARFKQGCIDYQNKLFRCKRP